MATKFDELRWKLFQNKKKAMTVSGLKNGLISIYNDKIIEKFRNVYYGGILASILLLSDNMTNGYCYDRALLAAKAFVDDENVDVNLLYVSINSIRLNPEYVDNKDPLSSDHCIVEITPNSGKSFIIDTSAGFIYDKDYYWKIEKPKVRHKNDKEKIKQFLTEDDNIHPEDIEKFKHMALLILPNIENNLKTSTKMYEIPGIELLQKEIEHYKQIIDYDSIKPNFDNNTEIVFCKKVEDIKNVNTENEKFEEKSLYKVKKTTLHEKTNNINKPNSDIQKEKIDER